MPVNNNGHRADEEHRVSQGAAAEVSKKPITVSSRKKVEANRRFFSKWLLVKHPDGKEDEGEYDDLHAALRRYYQPMDWLEELWMERIGVWSGGFADSSVVRAARLLELLPATVTISSNQKQPV